MQSDPHSFSEPDKAKVTHLRWDAEVDFVRKKIVATAEWYIQFKGGIKEIVLVQH